MKWTGFAGQSCAPAAAAVSRATTNSVLRFITTSVFLCPSACEQLEFGAQGVLHRVVLGLDLRQDAAHCVGVLAPRASFHVLAIAAERLGADVGAARFERVRRACDLHGVARAGGLLHLLH